MRRDKADLREERKSHIVAMGSRKKLTWEINENCLHFNLEPSVIYLI